MSEPVYTRAFLPPGPVLMHRKIALTPMIRCDGPFTVVTREGSYDLPAGWLGYIAIDQHGFPYPLALEEHEKSYEAVPDE